MSQHRLGARLRAIYTAGQEDSTLAILLGLRQHPCPKGKAGGFVERLMLIERDIRRTGKEQQLGPKESIIRHPAIRVERDVGLR